ncbi:hypothetical protein F2Q70_00003962 [Brassica cretica]|uniref:Uncharacterized protein n=1 Tax=Brassica cretica TaxID=69181 RepID=A0A8S9IMU8_BRACR|nr:hypothetical protein F2Q70_00003962 [Brassica cretica]
MILAPRPGRSIIDGIPNRDDRWREKFFVFKINPASVSDFDFGRIPRKWSDGIEPFGPAPPELPGLIANLRRGGNRATPIGPAAPVRPGKGRRNKRAREKEALPDRPDESYEVESPVSIAIPVGGARRAPNTSAGSVSDRALDDDVDSSIHRCERRGRV